jgi:flagellar biosynthesis GTPase FlhF
MKDKNTFNCNCPDGALLLKNLQARELSLVASPAYEKTVAKVYSFAASVNNLFSSPRNRNETVEIKNLSIGTDMIEDVRITRLEASVSALIAAFKAAEEEAEEEKKAELKAEEEQKLVAEEEEAKMVPVSKVAEEEEEKPEEEKKEDKEADKKIEKLEASIRQLASLMRASMITPETPEDEPADSTHKVPKITNEPVKSEKLKDGFKFPLETAGMKPGKIKASAGRAKGMSTSFTGSVAKDENVEQTAVDEIFGFAASRGTTPMNADSRIRTIRY